MQFKTLMDFVGNTPLVQLQRMVNPETNSVVLVKLEGNNPAGSVKDRAALNMIQQAEKRGDISPGDTLIEATSGNTGIALAMAASLMGYKIKLIMPENMSMERKASMAAYGAELITVTKEQGMEGARDLADEMGKQGQGFILDQFANPDNPLAHYQTTAPEIWRDTDGQITHFVSAMGTTGTIMGTSMYLKEQNPNIQIIGVQPEEGAAIPGIRRWPAEYMPKIYQDIRVDRTIDMAQTTAEETMRELAKQEGVFGGVSSGGAVAAALQVASEVNDAVIVTIICDRGDRTSLQGFIGNLMTREIERKFLLKNDDWKALAHQKTHFAQGYLNDIFEGGAKSSIRVRIEGEKANMNIKSLEIGLSRDEYEYEIPLAEGQKILATLAVGPVIEKNRYLVKVGQHTWEIDEFLGANLGLTVAEVEMASEQEQIEIPSWAGQEVTNATRYYNVSLSKHPFKDWSLDEKGGKN